MLFFASDILFLLDCHGQAHQAGGCQKDTNHDVCAVIGGRGLVLALFAGQLFDFFCGLVLTHGADLFLAALFG